MLAFYGGKPVAGPSFLYLSGPCGRLGGRHHVDAHVRPLLVVELHGASDRAPRLGNVAEHHALEQLVLHRAVDAFRLRVLLRVPAFRHADADAVPAQLRDVFAAGILAAPVGVVDEPAPLDPSVAQSHPQGFQGAGDAQRLAHAPSDYFLGISVHDHGQVAERVAVFLRPHGDIGDVANPQPVRSVGNVLLHEVGINRQPVGRVRRLRAARLVADLQPVVGEYRHERVPPHGSVAAERLLVHVPQLEAADAGVLAPDGQDIVDHELRPRRP